MDVVMNNKITQKIIDGLKIFQKYEHKVWINYDRMIEIMLSDKIDNEIDTKKLENLEWNYCGDCWVFYISNPKLDQLQV
jgi:hypothetical protein